LKFPHPPQEEGVEMSTEMETAAATIGAEVTLCEEVPMVRRERWEEIRRLWVTERVSIAEIARRLDLDRKTVRRCLRDTAWQPYHRPARPETLLTPHAEYLRERAEQVDYSAQILFQELRQRGYQGSYETVKLFVRPLRAMRLAAERALIRFETPPGRQSQIDWGHARVPFRPSSCSRSASADGATTSPASTRPCRSSWMRTSARSSISAATRGSISTIGRAPSVKARRRGESCGTPRFGASLTTGASNRGCVSPIAPRRRAKSSPG